MHWSFIIDNVTRSICGIGLFTASRNLVVAHNNSPFWLFWLDPGYVGSTLNDDESCRLCFRVSVRLQ